MVKRVAWSQSDKEALARIGLMRARGWTMKQMTTGTGLKRSRILKLIARKRAEYSDSLTMEEATSPHAHALRVKIGNKVYSAANTPIMLILPPAHKANIGDMPADDDRYAAYPNAFDPYIDAWMSDIPDPEPPATQDG